MVFVYLMIIHPEVQAKFQAELDEVVGRSRLPDFSDRENLPYVSAVYKELIRWHPISPFSAAHRAIMEDEYKGMRIPIGTAMIPNIWSIIFFPLILEFNLEFRGMARDKSVYGSDAESFRPERFVESELPDPSRIIFGFGRR